MRSCPSCGGIIGRDCFNPIECAQITASINSQHCGCGCEQLLTEINYIRGVDMPSMEHTIQEGCNVISSIIDLLPPEFDLNNEVLKQAENYYRQHYNFVKPETVDPDELPF